MASMAVAPPPPNRPAGWPNTRGRRMRAALLLGGCAVASIILSCDLLPPPSNPPHSQSLRRNLFAKQHLKPLTAAPNPSKETALFWHVPKSGGTTLKSLYKCMNQTLAVRVGAKGNKLRVAHRAGANFVNVDTVSREGILRAKDMGLVPSGMADLIVTSNLNFAVEHLYDTTHKGRVLALFRHPVERLVSKFYYQQVATWEQSYHPGWKNVDILHWAEHINKENNILVKILAGRDKDDEVNEKDLRAARMALQKRCIVGLMSEMEESVHRFNYFMGIDESVERNSRCMDEYFGHGVKKSNSNSHPKVEEGSPAWNVLAQKNALDIRLYDDIVHLFGLQRELIRSNSLSL